MRPHALFLLPLILIHNNNTIQRHGGHRPLARPSGRLPQLHRRDPSSMDLYRRRPTDPYSVVGRPHRLPGAAVSTPGHQPVRVSAGVIVIDVLDARHPPKNGQDPFQAQEEVSFAEGSSRSTPATLRPFLRRIAVAPSQKHRETPWFSREKERTSTLTPPPSPRE